MLLIKTSLNLSAPAPLWRERCGSVLVVTLLILMSLAGLTLDLSDETVLSLSLSGFSRDKFVAGQAARSGARFALHLIASDADKDVDTLDEEWAKFTTVSLSEEIAEGPSLTGRIVDESGKLNVNSILNNEGEIDEKRKSQITRLFGIFGVGEEKAVPILDWLDKDDIERMDGAESYYYQGLEDPYPCGNGSFVTVRQIFLVKGLRDLAIKGGIEGKKVDDYLTIYSDGKININTASPEVLQSMSDKMDASLAEAIVAHRKTSIFRKPEDLQSVPGMNEVYSGVSPWVTVKSSAFSVFVESAWSGVTSVARGVAAREKDQVKFVYWQVQ
jgi:general secretion pathway protein K